MRPFHQPSGVVMSARNALCVGLLTLFAASHMMSPADAASSPASHPAAAKISPSAYKLLENVVSAYKNIHSYQDTTTVRSTLNGTAKLEVFAIAHGAPNLLKFSDTNESNKSSLISDGTNLYFLRSKTAPDYTVTKAPKSVVAVALLKKYPNLSFTPFFALLGNQFNLKIFTSSNIGSVSLGGPVQISGMQMRPVNIAFSDGATGTWYVGAKDYVIHKTVYEFKDRTTSFHIEDDHANLVVNQPIKGETFRFTPAPNAKSIADEDDKAPSSAEQAKSEEPLPTIELASQGTLAQVISRMAQAAGIRMMAVLPETTLTKQILVEKTAGNIFEILDSLCDTYGLNYRVSNRCIIVEPAASQVVSVSSRPVDTEMFQFASRLSFDQLGQITDNTDVFAPSLTLADLDSASLAIVKEALQAHGPHFNSTSIGDLPASNIRLALSYEWIASIMIDSTSFDMTLYGDLLPPSTKNDALRLLTADRGKPEHDTAKQIVVRDSPMKTIDFLKKIGYPVDNVRVDDSLRSMSVYFTFDEPSKDVAITDFLSATSAVERNLVDVTYLTSNQLDAMRVGLSTYDRWRRAKGSEIVDQFDDKRGRPITESFNKLTVNQQHILLDLFMRDYKPVNPSMQKYTPDDLVKNATVQFHLQQRVQFRVLPNDADPVMRKLFSSPYQHEIVSLINS